MMATSSLKITTPSNREIAMTRVFDAPRKLVYQAHTKPELVQRWLLGPDGWSMPVCTIDLRVGGAYRYVWHRDRDGHEMGMGGICREIVPHERIVATENFDDAWYQGDAVTTTTFTEKAGKTTLTMTVLYDSKEIRDNVLKSGMETGVERSYDRLEEMLATGS